MVSGRPASTVEGAPCQPRLPQRPAGGVHLLQQQLEIGLHQLQRPAHVSGDEGAIGAAGGAEGDAHIDGDLLFSQLPLGGQGGPGAVGGQGGPDGGDPIFPLQLGDGLRLCGPGEHGPGGQLHRAHPGESPPGGLLAQQGAPGLVKGHFQGVLHHMIDLLRALVQGIGGEIALPPGGLIATKDLRCKAGGLSLHRQGKDGGVVPIQTMPVILWIFRPLPGKQGEHHLLGGIVIALRAPVYGSRLQI